MKKKAVRKRVSKKVITETVDDEGNRKTVVKEHAPEEIVRPKRRTVKKINILEDGEARAKKMTAREREELLIENFVGLQHAMTNMSIKFGNLSDNISKLLQIFEESAKNFVSGGKPDDKELLEKIDSLLNQNKTIAKGLVLMEGKLRGRSESSQVSVPPRIESSVRPQLPPQQPRPENRGPRPFPRV